MAQLHTTLERLAHDTLALFAKVADNARRMLQADGIVSVGGLAAGNTFNNTQILGRRVRERESENESLHVLAREPAIARIVARNEAGNERTIYVCRAATGASPGVVSYLAPIGRLASLPPGSEEAIQTPSGLVNYYVVENAELHPNATGREWDSIDSVIHADGSKPITIRSFLALLRTEADDDVSGSILDRLLAEEKQSENIFEGIRRNVITQMGLRDQPVLDRYQDEIFRLPLKSTLIIVGPPGSGKTTTLIRRLRQKLNYTEFGELEASAMPSQSERKPGDSWIMFSPTELLKQYLKEAFAREHVPASDDRVRTWNNYRRELARNRLGILRDSTGRGTFVLREGSNALDEGTVGRQIEWFSDFQEWHRNTYWTELRAAAQTLRNEDDNTVSALGARLERTVAGNSAELGASNFLAMFTAVDDIQAFVTAGRDSVDQSIRKALTVQLNRDRNFLDNLAKFLETLSDAVDDPDESDTDDDDDLRPTRFDREAAMTAYTMAVRSQSRADITKRALSRGSRAGKIVEWLGDRIPNAAERLEIGKSLLHQAAGRQFLSPARRYVHGIATRYRKFRRTRQGEARWYGPGSLVTAEIGPLELDLVLCSELQLARQLISDQRIAQSLDETSFAFLKQFQDEFKIQVVVDEATDFSPIQLACMYALTIPRAESFFACGDFNQRITEWGVRTNSELAWACPGISTRSIVISYRHSRQLYELATELVRLSSGTETRAELPSNRDNDGVNPVLAKNLLGSRRIGEWLANRIKEIEQFVSPMPSIGVLVNSEEEVIPLAAALNEALVSHNIQAVACTDGRFVGQENDVRVFDVQHIKGLEFEAVFFISVDHLADLSPDLFAKYLYVGATRAATYLGWTCAGEQLPNTLRELENRFSDCWDSKAVSKGSVKWSVDRPH